jgi:signal peptide peptidase SppA
MGHALELENADVLAGCRPDQLFGLWAIETKRFGQMVPLALQADLAQLRKEARKRAELRATQPLYSVTSDAIAVVEVTGPMTKYETSFQALFGGTSTLRARRALRQAARDPEVSGIMVVFDSPGGTIAGTGDLADEIRAADARKPTYTYAADLMASAALWAGSAGRRVFANRSAEIGSIGVYAVVYDTSGIYAQEGVKVHVISSAPPLKGAGVDGTEITPAQLAEWERQVKDLAAVFVDDALIKHRRMTKEKAQSLATGQVWVAEQAREHGLIDGVLTLDEAMARLRSEAMNEQELKAAKETAERTAEAETAAREKAEREAAELRKKLAESETKSQALEREKRDARFKAEAAAIGAPEAFAAVLDKLEAAAGAELYGQLHTQLKAFAEQIAKGSLFTEAGSSGGAAPGAGTAAAQLHALADKAVKDGRAKTREQALVLVTRESPELAKQHLKESRGK